mgnify:CR=1 FL=1
MTARTSDVRWLLKDALRVVSKRKRLIFGLFLIVALGISVAVVSVPTSYEVAGKLVVTRERGDLLVTPGDQRNFNYAVTAPTIQDMAVHAELLKNRSLVEAVVKQLGLDRGAATSASEARLNGQVETILNGLTIQVVPNSNLIYVRYRSTDPVKGADIVNALLDQYRETYLHMRATPGVTRFFEEERDKLAASLKKSEHTLTAFRNKTALAAAATQVDAYSRRLAEAEYDAIDAQHDLKESEQRAAIIKEELDREPERIQFSSTIRYNPMIQALQERLLALEMEEQQFLTLYTDTDRRVQDKRTEIEAQKQRLAEAQARGWVPRERGDTAQRPPPRPRGPVHRGDPRRPEERAPGRERPDDRRRDARARARPGRGRRPEGSPQPGDPGQLRHLPALPQEGRGGAPHRRPRRQHDHQRGHRRAGIAPGRSSGAAQESVPRVRDRGRAGVGRRRGVPARAVRPPARA